MVNTVERSPEPSNDEEASRDVDGSLILDSCLIPDPTGLDAYVAYPVADTGFDSSQQNIIFQEALYRGQSVRIVKDGHLVDADSNTVSVIYKGDVNGNGNVSYFEIPEIATAQGEAPIAGSPHGTDLVETQIIGDTKLLPSEGEVSNTDTQAEVAAPSRPRAAQRFRDWFVKTYR